MKNAAKIVNSAILGMDFQTVVINGKVYVIMPPTIHKIAGAGYYLSDLVSGNTVKDVLASLGNVNQAAHALSWFIQGDDLLSEELSKGTFEEVVEALEKACSLISSQDFFKLSALAKSVASLTANQRQ